MAHKKGKGSVRNGRDSVSKRLGVKEYGGQFLLLRPATSGQFAISHGEVLYLAVLF